MGRYLMPSKWGMKIIDLIAIFILIALIIKVVAPTTGLAIAIATFCHWLALGVQWISALLVQFLNWI